MKIKTSELINHALDWVVAKCEEWFGGSCPHDGAENEWLHTTLDFLEKLK